MQRWIKIALKTFAIIIAVILIAFVGIVIYVNSHKKSLLVSITKQLNKNLNGKLIIGSMDPTFLRGFPGVSLTLNNVVMQDSLWSEHKHTLLKAKDFNVSVNTLALLRGAIEIKKVEISNAEIYLFTDSNGYSNTSIFKKKPVDSAKKNDGETATEIKLFSLDQVTFVLNNKKGNKLFQFSIDNLKGKIDYGSSGWHADIRLEAIARSLAFNTKRGSFIKDKHLEGPFSIHYNEDAQIVTIDSNYLKIGNDPFLISGKFELAGLNPARFSINIFAKDIMWKSAATLLAPNIKKRLDLFNFKNPINVKCSIVGNMGPGGDPNINVIADIKNNELTTPGGIINKTNFLGQYTNNFKRGNGFNDENSAINLFRFSGAYEDIPFTIDTASINNFKKPIATGVFKSNFDITKLNNALGNDLLHFTKGTANVRLTYKADLVNFKINKPIITGLIDIKNANVSYVPRKLSFVNTAISLNFTGPDLFINNIRLQSGRSIVFMDGSIRNFLNLYYSDPEKIQLNWKIKSPQLYLGEFLGFFGTRTYVNRNKHKSANTNISKDLNTVFEKSKVNMNVHVDKLYYSKFLATDAIADLFVSESGIKISNLSVRHGGGSLKLDGNIYQQGGRNQFLINTVVANVNIKSFFYGFDNFGLKSFKSDNLRGNLFSKIKMGGSISDKGSLVPNSLNGNVVFDLKNGALINFDPLISVGKFAFPLRDLNNIVFNNLNGKFDIKGDKIKINPMLISSSVLNMDVAGVYSLNKGTNIALDIPLRNPKKDEEITDVSEKKERRMNGIVLHLTAFDGEDGKIKFKLNKNRDKK